MMKTTAFAAAVAVSLSALSLSAVIAPPAAASEIRVSVPYGDIDMRTRGGSDILNDRLKVAVATACERPASRDLKSNAQWQNCRQAARDDVSRQLQRKGFGPTGGHAAAPQDHGRG